MHARRSSANVIALPSFLFATSRIISGYVGGLPGIHAMWSGSDWNWHKPVNRNDEITTEAWLKDLIVHDTRFAGRAVQQIYHVDFFNQKGELVADADSWCFRTERDHAREKGTKYKELRQKPVRRYYRPGAGGRLQALRRGEDPRRRARATGRTSRKARHCRRW